MTAIYDAAMAPLGIGTAQFALLRQLEPDGEAIGLSELSERLDLDRSTVGRNVRVLERMGLVRTGVGLDQRATTITLTNAGRSALKKGVPLWEQAQREFEARVGTAEARDLRNLLQSL